MAKQRGRKQVLETLCIFGLCLHRLAAPNLCSSYSYAAEAFTPLPNPKARGAPKETNAFIITSAISGSNSDGDGASSITNFVKSLDSALGNPTSATDAVMKSTTESVTAASIIDKGESGINMAISNEVILVVGAAFALALAGVAFALSQKDTTTQDIPEPSNAPGEGEVLIERLEISLQSKEEEEGVMTEPEEAQEDSVYEPKAEEEEVVTEPEEAQEDSVYEPRLSNEEASLSPVSTVSNEASVESSKKKDALTEEKAKRKEAEQKSLWIQSLANKLSAKLQAKSEELETNTRMLEETKLSLTELMDSNTVLQAKYREEKEALSKTSEQLAAAVETNQVLEDQYELEQNRLEATKRELDSTREDLNETQRKLSKASTELIDTKTQLQLTRGRLTETTTSLETLEKEQGSVRTLGRKIWQLSKARVQQRARRMRDRLRRNNPDSE